MDEETGTSSRASAEPITTVVADRVRQAREQLNLSQSELAERMRDHGVPWTQSTVVSLERRGSTSQTSSSRPGRDAITLREWMTLARVLREPPLWLLTPSVRAEDAVQGTPGWWSDVLWIIGQPLTDDDPFSGYGRNHRANIDTVRHLADLVEHLDRIEGMRAYQEGLPPGAPLPFDVDDVQRETLEKISAAVRRMRAAGLAAPELPNRVHDRAAAVGVDYSALTG